MPCLIREISDEDAFHLAFIDNKERNNLNPLEEAEHYSECCKKGMSQTDIAKKYKVSQSWISHNMLLLILPTNIQEQVSSQLLTSMHAYEISKICNPSDLKKVFTENKEFT